MLWQKEKGSNLYSDLFENMIRPTQLVRLKRNKSNADSLTARLIGNEKFKEGDFRGAMDKYNQSICLAENGSEYLSIAYGNRSSCFEKLEKYNFCLVDIQLAKDNNYPLRLMQKLDNRKAKCLLQIQSTDTILVQPQSILSYPAAENLPCMANVLRIDRNDDYGRLILATQDIHIGDTVIVEEDYVRFVVGENIRCSNCGKRYVNFVPCEKCGGAMFCGERCLKNSFHQMECEMLFYLDICNSGNFFPVFVLRSIIIGISAFSSVAEMMKFVENCKVGDPNEIPISTSSHASRYRAFFKLSAFIPDQLSDQYKEFSTMAYSVYHSITSSALAAQFQTVAQRRFLMHLAIHHSFILRTNSFGSFETSTISGITNADNDYEQSLLLVTSYLNHACCPNVAKLKMDNLSICKAILPIKKGEQLFISYVDEDNDKYNSLIDRQRYLQDAFGFTCKCEICEKGTMRNTFTLQDDSAFINVVNGLKTLENHFSISTVSDVIENCKRFLIRFPKMVLSPESVYVKHNLVAMMQLELDYQAE
ncbi:hypothetical protein HA402_005264 [Bradysia odoriphaga]|nr:hypothetical protein HA402_005264 [Bradysia odoriphaga]